MQSLEPVAKISERLRYAMDLRGLRQVDLVERTKIPKSSIHQYLIDYAEPKTDRIYLLAKALRVNPVWLMGLDAPMEVNQSVDYIINEGDVSYLLEIANDMDSKNLSALISYAEFLKGNKGEGK